MRRKVALAPLWPQSGRMSVGLSLCVCRSDVFVPLDLQFSDQSSSRHSCAVAFPVQLRIMAVVESVLRFGCLAVVLRRAASPPPNSCTISALCDLWMKSTAEVGVSTSMFWFSPYKMARGVLNAIVVSVY